MDLNLLPSHPIIIKDDIIEKACILAFGEDKNYNEHFYITCIKPGCKPIVYRASQNNVYNICLKSLCPDGYNSYISSNPLKANMNTKVNDSCFDFPSLEYVESTSGTAYIKGKYNASNCEENKFSLRNIVIDIDWHNITDAEKINELCNLFIENLNETSNIPTPNIINYTGRGLQLWWCLEEEAWALKWLYSKIVTKLCDEINTLLSNNKKMFHNACVDYAASLNSAGLFRMFGSYNFNINTRSNIIINKDNRYNIDELKNLLNIIIEKKPKVTKIKKRKSKKHTHYLKRRIALIESYVNFRKGLGEELRHITLHLYHNFYLQLTNEETAREKTLYLNSLFDNPLRINEVESIIRCNMKHGTYKYKDSTFLEKLQADPNILKRTVKKKKGLSLAKKKKLKRDKMIIEYYIESKDYIYAAYAAGVSESTVRNLIRKNKDYVKSEIIRRAKLIAKKKFKEFLFEQYNTTYYNSSYYTNIVVYKENIIETLNTYNEKFMFDNNELCSLFLNILRKNLLHILKHSMLYTQTWFKNIIDRIENPYLLKYLSRYQINKIINVLRKKGLTIEDSVITISLAPVFAV